METHRNHTHNEFLRISRVPLKAGRANFNEFLKNRGFTLMEMVVSLGLFSVLVVAAMGVIISISNAQIKAANIQTIQDNIRFALELITKEARTGTDFQLSVVCASGPGEELSFTTAAGSQRIYYRSGTELKRIAGSTDCEESQPVSSEDVEIETLRFILSGEIPGPNDGQPRITLAARLRSVSAKFQLESSMNLQTTIIQRLRDL